ncbi:hypothetical protein B0H13DRAFT_2030936 [Mycena leptocephala]|nr:hypothetical protein B0H13DRAFT_2030936 [Mycena leptocephala]
MSPPTPVGRNILYVVLGLVAQTLFFGQKRGLKTTAHMILLVITLFMYLLSATYWAYRIADVISRMYIFIGNPQAPVSSPVTRLLTLFNALTLLNYILCDGVVIWRARLICSPDHRKYLYFPLFCLGITAVAVCGVIGLRIAGLYLKTFGETLIKVVDILQISALILSLISNLSSTGVVGIAAWRHREAVRVGFQKTTKGDQILRILLESGVLYCISGLLGLACSLIRLPHTTLALGDLYTPVNVQIAGMYTPVVLLLVSMQRSLSETSFLGTFPDHTCQASPTVSRRPIGESMQFGPRAAELMDAEIDRGFAEIENTKGHRHHVSDATLVV